MGPEDRRLKRAPGRLISQFDPNTPNTTTIALFEVLTSPSLFI